MNFVVNTQIPNFLTPVESKAFIKVAEEIGFLHQGSLGPTKGEAYRDNDRIAVQDPVLADAIWNSGLKNLFSDIKIRGKVAVGLNPNIRCYRSVALYYLYIHCEEYTVNYCYNIVHCCEEEGWFLVFFSVLSGVDFL